MTRELRWRIITLQVVMILIFAFGAGVAFYGSNFTTEQIRSQLAPQQIFFPKDLSDIPADWSYRADLQKYAGQQVLTGDQAHVYADGYIGLHLKELAGGKPYSVLSAEARAEKDPALKAQKDALVQTAFRGEMLRATLNQAWAFSIFGTLALYAAIGLTVAALVVLGALVYELFFARRPVDESVFTPSTAPTPTATRA